MARRQHARVAAGDDRARRLPARQRDVRARRAGAADRDLRLGAGDDRRPARRRRLPDRDLGRAGRPERRRCSTAVAVTPREGFPTRDELSRATRSARALDVGPALVPGARALEGGGLHGGQLQAARSPARPTTRTSSCFDEGVPQLAEAAHEITPDAGGAERRARAARRLRRRPDDQRVRLLPGVLRGRGPRPRRGQAGLPRRPARRSRCCVALEEGELDARGVRAARSAALLGVSTTAGPVDRLFAGMRPGRGDARRGAPRARGRASSTGLISNSWGTRPLRPRDCSRSCSTAS